METFLAIMGPSLVAGPAIGAAAGALSCVLVLKGWALMGDAIAHAVLPGIVAAYVLGLPLAVGAFAAGLGCGVLTGWVADNARVKRDTVMGVVFSAMFALGVVWQGAVESDVHLDHILFGDLLGLGWGGVWQTVTIAALALALLVAKRRDLLVFAFDPGHGRVAGLRIGWLHYGLLAGIALVTVGALQAVGLILTIALLIVPGATAHLLTDRFDAMLALGAGCGALASVLGAGLSFVADAGAGASVVVVLMAQFVAALVLAPKHGLLASRSRAAHRAAREAALDEHPSPLDLGR